MQLLGVAGKMGEIPRQPLDAKTPVLVRSRITCLGTVPDLAQLWKLVPDEVPTQLQGRLPRLGLGLLLALHKTFGADYVETRVLHKIQNVRKRRPKSSETLHLPIMR